MLEYLKPNVQAKKPEKIRAWSCVICGVSVKRDEAWIDERGQLCHKHGVRLKIKRFAKDLR